MSLVNFPLDQIPTESNRLYKGPIGFHQRIVSVARRHVPSYVSKTSARLYSQVYGLRTGAEIESFLVKQDRNVFFFENKPQFMSFPLSR